MVANRQPGTLFPSASHGRRIAVVGTTGAGKTTLAQQLSRILRIPHVELDALHWGPDWAPADVETFRARTSQALLGDTWVSDGNYHAVRDIVWGQADTIIWLDYPLPTALWRLWWRTLRRVFAREELWNRNRERFREQFFSRDSLFLWALRSARRRRREYPALLSSPEYQHLEVVHLRSPRATRAWLASLQPRGAAGAL